MVGTIMLETFETAALETAMFEAFETVIFEALAVAIATPGALRTGMGALGRLAVASGLLERSTLGWEMFVGTKAMLVTLSGGAAVTNLSIEVGREAADIVVRVTLRKRKSEMEPMMEILG
jgi:hypothetical protein